ncbi:hypothetical protein HWB99_gp063 [Mycobacterium phage DrLupo]|uniref:Uncharacterized protein n=1 Tax=Mycobacterium phage DrLupo TaxID=2499037 RepID=A0A3S9UQL7_9CAUD|nr:hypothetical protein HWB99_gp063 [Mycobacterium phage DrLupo]AZS12599.1 hypothetical protein SEA_DRLUPO_63 [Mycobacterium phage DrLupo]
MTRRIGFEPVPDFTDAELVEFLKKTITNDTDHLLEILEDLIGTVEETKANGQAEEFAYAKLMNYLTQLPKPVRIHLCAAALWKLHGQENADLRVLRYE